MPCNRLTGFVRSLQECHTGKGFDEGCGPKPVTRGQMPWNKNFEICKNVTRQDGQS